MKKQSKKLPSRPPFIVDFGTKYNTIKQELNLNVLALNMIFFSCKNCSGLKKLLWKKTYHIHGLDLIK